MPLTADQQAELDALLAAQNAPAHRTRSGLAGVLHALIESASGAVPHRSPEQWTELAELVEELAGDQDAESGDQPAGAEQPGEAAGG
jgi:hypothetical protein